MQEATQISKRQSNPENTSEDFKKAFILGRGNNGVSGRVTNFTKAFQKQVVSDLLESGGANEVECPQSRKENNGNNLKELDFTNSQLSWEEIKPLLTKSDFVKSLQDLNLSQNYLQDKEVKLIAESKTPWIFLKKINLADNHFGTIGAKSLSYSSALKSLEQLDLSRNCIRNEGIKFIAESSVLSELKILILNDISVDYHGIRYLVTNKSWINLEELCLQDNPLIGDLGAIELSLAKQWKNLKKLMLNNSNVGPSGMKFLSRNKVLKRLSLDLCIQNTRLQNGFCSEEKITRKAFLSRQLKSLLLTQSRGGGMKDYEKSPEENEDQSLLKLLDKIDQYKRRFQDTEVLGNEPSVYFESLGRPTSTHGDPASESFVLAFEIKKRLLSSDSKLKVLLITGEAGIGKTLFCRYLQTAMLTEWNDSFDDQSNERVWIPVLVNLSRYAHSKESTPLTLTDVLKNQLSLTDSEIKSLQENHSNKLLPYFLFIFDEYDWVLQSQNKSLVNYTIDDCIKNNFCCSSGFETYLDNARIIVTCRTEALSHLERKDVLFGLLGKSTRNILPESYSEFILQPFTDAQITSYLRKYSFSNHLRRLDNEDMEVACDSVSESWSLVKEYEKTIDSYELRELVRTPLLLFVVVNVLPDLIIQEKELNRKNLMPISAQNNDARRMLTRFREEVIKKHQDKNKSKKLTRYQLYQLFLKVFINRTFESSLGFKKQNQNQEDQQASDCHNKKIKHQLQNYALGLRNYCSNVKEESQQLKLEEINCSITYCPLLRYGSNEPVVFYHRSFQDFLIATKIEEEILEEFNDKRDMILLNQKLLVNDSASLSVLRFLVDTIVDERIPAKALIKLIQKFKHTDLQLLRNLSISRNKSKPKVITPLMDYQTQSSSVPQEEEVKLQNASQDHHERHPFSVAAANAITILNASGHDLSRMNFSGVCFAGADLSGGIFEGSNFTGADLQEVNFSGAWLKDTKFIRTNMDGVRFGVSPDLPIGEEANCIATSPDGESIVIDSRGEMIEFKKQQTLYTEFRRLKDHVGDIKTCSFSADGKYLITSGEDRTIRVWEYETGKCVDILRGYASNVIGCKLSQDSRQIISLEEDWTIKKQNFTGSEWILSFQLCSDNIISFGFVPKYNQLLYVGTNDHTTTLYHSTVGYICKYQKIFGDSSAANSRFTSDGKQIVMRDIDDVSYVLDSVRGHLIKSLDESDDSFTEIETSRLSSCDTPIISADGENLKIRDITDGKLEVKRLNSRIVRFATNRPDKKLVALTEHNVLVFLEAALLQTERPRVPINGINQKGFNLTGTNIDDSSGLSDENVLLFAQIGDYNGFGKNTIQELLLNSERFSELEKTEAFYLHDKNLKLPGASIIGRNSKWISLKKLDLSENSLQTRAVRKLERIKLGRIS